MLFLFSSETRKRRLIGDEFYSSNTLKSPSNERSLTEKITANGHCISAPLSSNEEPLEIKQSSVANFQPKIGKVTSEFLETIIPSSVNIALIPTILTGNKTSFL